MLNDDLYCIAVVHFMHLNILSRHHSLSATNRTSPTSSLCILKNVKRVTQFIYLFFWPSGLHQCVNHLMKWEMISCVNTDEGPDV